MACLFIQAYLENMSKITNGQEITGGAFSGQQSLQGLSTTFLYVFKPLSLSLIDQATLPLCKGQNLSGR